MTRFEEVFGAPPEPEKLEPEPPALAYMMMGALIGNLYGDLGMSREAVLEMVTDMMDRLEPVVAASRERRMAIGEALIETARAEVEKLSTGSAKAKGDGPGDQSPGPEVPVAGGKAGDGEPQA